MSLYINATRSLVAVEYREDHERFLLVEEINSLLEKLCNQRSLLSIEAVQLPDLWIKDRWEHSMLGDFFLNLKLLLVILGKDLELLKGLYGIEGIKTKSLIIANIFHLIRIAITLNRWVLILIICLIDITISYVIDEIFCESRSLRL
jgi:hypothetical protein